MPDVFSRSPNSRCRSKAQNLGAAKYASPIMEDVRQSLSDQTVAFSLEGVPDERGDRPACPVCRRPVYFLWAKRLFGKDPGVCLYFADTNEVVSFMMDEERAKGLVEKITAGA
ncbi:MAG: hypothetical protein VB020_04370 [Methanocorpusculum sp.]|nr:hypothetical protein [Methanocorpusculum sp.]